MSERINNHKVNPAGLKALGQLYAQLKQCSLPATLIDLAYLRASQINGCAYCLEVHSADLMKEGVPAAKLMLVAGWRDAGPVFDARERAALAWTERLTRVADAGVPDADYEAARAVFSEAELTDLTYAIALMNAFNRINVAFGREPASVQQAA